MPHMAGYRNQARIHRPHFRTPKLRILLQALGKAQIPGVLARSSGQSLASCALGRLPIQATFIHAAHFLLPVYFLFWALCAPVALHPQL